MIADPAPVAVQVLAEGLRFPEGPAFDSRGRLWLVELKGAGLAWWQDGRLTRVPVGGAPNGIAIDARDRVWFCDSAERAIRRHDPATGATETMVAMRDGVPLDKPNDLCFDAAGNLLFTCPGDSRSEPTGYVCCLSVDGVLTTIADGKFFPNGLALVGGDLVLAETYRQRLWRGRWDAASRTWVDARPWSAGTGGKPGPDGMALGADGRLYVAVYGAGAIKVVEADGAIAAAYALPGQNPTNCAFDPARRLGLVVTEAETGRLLSLPALGPGAALHDGKERP